MAVLCCQKFDVCMKMELKSLCRACLVSKPENTMSSVFAFNSDSDDMFFTNKVIKEISNIEVELGDEMPDKICAECIIELKRSYKFILQLQSSDRILRNYKTDEVEVNFDDKDDSLLSLSVDVLEEEFDTDYTENFQEETVVESDDDKPLAFRLAELNASTTNVAPENNEENKTISDSMTGDHDNENKLIKTKKCYFCDECDKSFVSKKAYMKHKTIHHPKTEHQCEKCGKSFKLHAHLKVHMRSHFTDKEKPHICPHCGQMYAYQYQLTKHMYKHNSDQPFPCLKCEKRCMTSETLRRHMRVHDEDYDKMKLICNVCGKRFAYPSGLSEHMKNHTGEKPFLCSVCGKAFRQKGSLAYHMRYHTGTRPYECTVCKSTFYTQGVLKVHMRRHTDERPYVCDYCGKAFRQSTDMRNHRRIHTGFKPVECTVCHKKMATTGQLTIHMRTHTGEKPYACGTCFKAFATKTMVIKHMRCHTGEKPYICNKCGKSFSQSSSLNTHLKVHRKPTEEIKTTEL